MPEEQEPRGAIDVTSIDIGDVIELGTYSGMAIRWVCIGVDDNGPLMLAESNICFKAFDAAGDSDYHIDSWGYVRKQHGSNCWEDSSLRQWLNSVGEVSWTHCPPDSSAVLNGLNPYSDEQGFLSNFTEDELTYVKSVAHTVYLNTQDSSRDGYCTGGTKKRGYYGNISDIPEDTSWFWQKEIEDRFFLLNYDQLREAYVNSDESRTALFSEEAPWWTGDAVDGGGANFENEHIVNVNKTTGGDYDWANAFDGALGVRPAFYLNVSSDNNRSYRPSRDALALGFNYGLDQWVYGRRDENSTLSRRVFERVVRPCRQADWVQWYQDKKANGNQGLCHGYSLVSALVYRGLCPMDDWELRVSDYFQKKLKEIEYTPEECEGVLASFTAATESGNLSDIPLPLDSNDSVWCTPATLNLMDLVEACYDAQYLPVVQKTSLLSPDELLEAARQSIDEDKPILINLGWKKNPSSRKDNSTAGHTLVPYAIEETDEGFNLLVYNCNWGNREGHSVSFFRDGKGKLQWELDYDDRDPKSNEKGSHAYIEDTETIEAEWDAIARSPFAIRDYPLFVSAGASLSKDGRVLLDENNADYGTFEGSGVYPVTVANESPEITDSEDDLMMFWVDEGSGTDLTVACEEPDTPSRAVLVTSKMSLDLSSGGPATYTLDETDAGITAVVEPSAGSPVTVSFESDGLDETSVVAETSSTVEVSGTLEALEVQGASQLTITSRDEETDPLVFGQLDESETYTVTMGEEDVELSDSNGAPVVSTVDISAATVTVAAQACTGKALQPLPVVTLNDQTLIKGTDYGVSYANNINPGTAIVTITGIGRYAGAVTQTFQIVKVWDRVWGNNALDTMQAIAGKFGKAGVAIVTTNANFKDALAASCLAGRYNALVLTTPKGSVATQTKTALKAAGVKTVYLVGNTSDVTAATEKALKSGAGVTKVTRISGASPSTKAIAVAKACGKRSDTVIIATQGSFKDALSIAPYSYATKSPILYAETNKKLSSATLGYIKSAKYKKAIVVGGPVALPATIDAQLKSAGITTVTRLAGGNSYETSLLIARWATGQLKAGNYGTYQGKALAYVKFQPSMKLGSNSLAVATGQNWKDALCGAALCGKNRSVLLLADASNSTNASFCKDNKASIQRAYVFGGSSAVSAGVWDTLVQTTAP